MLRVFDQCWNKTYEGLKVYRRRHPGAWPRRAYVAQNGTRLGAWCREQRRLWRHGGLKPDRRLKLDALGFEWELHRSRWRRAFAELMHYRRQHPHAWPAARHASSRGLKLGMWCAIQRYRRKQGVLSEERIAKLDSIRFPWKLANDIWDRAYPALRAYRWAHAGGWPPRNYVTHDGLKLGAWCANAKFRIRSRQMPEDRARALRRLPFR